MKNKLKSKFNIWYLGFFAAIFSSLFIIFFGEDYAVITALIPLTYAIMVTVSGAGNNFLCKYMPGMTCVNIIYFGKSCIYPFFQSITHNDYMLDEHLNLAVLLTIGEIVVIYSVFWVLKHRKKELQSVISEFELNNILTLNKVVILGFLALTALLILVYPSVLNDYNFFFVRSTDVIKQKASMNTSPSIASIFVGWAKFILPVIVYQACYVKYKKTNKNRYVIFAFACVLIVSTIVEGVSRSSFVLPALCSFCLLIRLFPKQTKKITAFFVTVLCCVFLVFTVTKFGSVVGSDGSPVAGITDTLQAYLCGYKNMEISIKTEELYGSSIGVDTLLSDLLGNWMGIGKLFRDSPSTSQFFNFTMYGNTKSVDQIIPTVGQSFLQFGPFLPYVYTIIMMIVIVNSDRKYRTEKRIDYAYLLLYISIKCAITLMGNFKIFMANVLNTVLPIFIILYLNHHFVVRIRQECNLWTF